MGRLLSLVVICVACTPVPPPVPAPTPEPVVCPEPPPPPECPEESAKVVRVQAPCKPCADVAHGNKGVPQKTAPLTCVTGHVMTAGELRMVVQRAHVELRHQNDVLAESWTDDKGAFAACVDSRRLAKPLDVSLHVSKKPFDPVTITTKLSQGQHQDFPVPVQAEGLTN